MGNQPSSGSSSSGGNGGHRSSHSHSSSHHHHHHHHFHHHHQNVSLPNPIQDLKSLRRESIHGITVKGAAVPPSASLESAHSKATTPAPSSTDIVSNVANTLRVAHDSTAATLTEDRMGNEQSRHRHGRDGASNKSRSAPSSEKPSPSPQPPSQPQPVDVPTPSAPSSDARSAPLEPPLPPSESDPLFPQEREYFVPPPQYVRPPRLPLPIEEEVHTPGSPIISPDSGLEDGEEVPGLPRRASVLSSTTADDDDLGDEEEPQTKPTVPTLIEWEGPGKAVYVTGTFVDWNRKFRLRPNGPSKKKDVLSTIVNIVPGTHHIMFLVDGNMITSDKLPTAVDYTNILVNYLEVSYDDVPKPATDAKDAAAVPAPTPGAVQELRAPPGVYPPQTLPPTPELVPVQQPAPTQPKTPVPVPTAGKYHSVIPRYLLDLDAPEDSSRFARANAVTNTSSQDSPIPPPPTLPLFLNKSILNGAMPMKDDSSVLIMPNHTVLNHLATSSIKDGILATSATTRYKNKFLTTIMYKPKGTEA